MNRIHELWDSAMQTVTVTLYVLMLIGILCAIIWVGEAR